MKRLDQCRLHPKREVPGLACPGRGSNSASLVGGEQKSLLIAIRNIYIVAPDIASPSACVT